MCGNTWFYLPKLNMVLFQTVFVCSSSSKQACHCVWMNYITFIIMCVNWHAGILSYCLVQLTINRFGDSFKAKLVWVWVNCPKVEYKKQHQHWIKTIHLNWAEWRQNCVGRTLTYIFNCAHKTHLSCLCATWLHDCLYKAKCEFGLHPSREDNEMY